MTPTELVELAEAKDLMKNRQYRRALDKLYKLAGSYPQDMDLQNLINICLMEDARNTAQWAPSPPPPSFPPISGAITKCHHLHNPFEWE